MKKAKDKVTDGRGHVNTTTLSNAAGVVEGTGRQLKVDR